MFRAIVGLIVAAVAALIIFGGVQRIANLTQVIVPFMAIAYLLIGGFVVISINDPREHSDELVRELKERFALAVEQLLDELVTRGAQSLGGGVVLAADVDASVVGDAFDDTDDVTHLRPVQ